MGGGSWSSDHFKATSAPRAHAPIHSTFKATTLHEDVDPAKMKGGLRESRDSADHPESNAIIVAFDHTGSMGEIPHFFAKEGLGTLMDELLKKQPVPHPQLLVAAVGDSTCDPAALEVGQFESDNRIDDHLTKFWLVGGGGGQQTESYGLVHYFAGKHTSLDCFEKRGRKGALFTIGDEHPWEVMQPDEIERVFGYRPQGPVKFADALASAQRMYDVYHIIVESRSYRISDNRAAWKKYLPQTTLELPDYKALPELILTTLAASAGMDLARATAGFSAKTTDMVLRSGVASLPVSAGKATGIVSI